MRFDKVIDRLCGAAFNRTTPFKEIKSMNMKYLIPMACLALSCLCMNPALAHGDVKPQYGGIVQKVNDVSFELVVQADGAIIYLMDHGKPGNQGFRKDRKPLSSQRRWLRPHQQGLGLDREFGRRPPR